MTQFSEQNIRAGKLSGFGVPGRDVKVLGKETPCERVADAAARAGDDHRFHNGAVPFLTYFWRYCREVYAPAVE